MTLDKSIDLICNAIVIPTTTGEFGNYSVTCTVYVNWQDLLLLIIIFMAHFVDVEWYYNSYNVAGIHSLRKE